MAAARERWRAVQPYLDPARLVFLDESGVNTKMTRLYGWAPKGERLKAKAPFGHWKTMTFIAGLRLHGLTAPWLLDGAMDGDAFRTYVRKVLAPTLAAGDIVVMDDLPAHKVAGIQEAIRARDAQPFYLPAYSPDLNPIELVFAKPKALLREAKERSIPGLLTRIGVLLDRFEPAECAAYFRHAGYQYSM